MSAAATAAAAAESRTSAEGRDLVLVREFDASPEKLYRAWTEPGLITQWFTLGTWRAANAELNVRPGGTSLVTMRGPDGAEFPNRDVYLEVVPNKRLVLTDAYTSAWVPSEQPFMTVTLTFDQLPGGRTRYTARVSHWTVADRERHEEMGFHQNWPTMTEHLAAMVANL
jgi:uncharacterized protein YndB with AHSA1/START domain